MTRNASGPAIHVRILAAGVSLLYATRTLDKLLPAKNDQKLGINIVRRALQAPTRQLAERHGIDGSIVV